jgi:hypothetical protein
VPQTCPSSGQATFIFRLRYLKLLAYHSGAAFGGSQAGDAILKSVDCQPGLAGARHSALTLTGDTPVPLLYQRKQLYSWINLKYIYRSNPPEDNNHEKSFRPYAPRAGVICGHVAMAGDLRRIQQKLLLCNLFLVPGAIKSGD